MIILTPGASPINGSPLPNEQTPATPLTSEADATGASAKVPGDGRSTGDRTARAEMLLDRMGGGVSRFAAYLKTNVLCVSARVREAFEDFWAETQNIRHGKRS